MLSQRTKYALKALMSLADEAVREDGDPLTIEEIARRSGTPKRFLEHILLELRNAGYISSRRGRAGGYVLIKEPKAISLGDLLRRVDGPIAPLPCLSRQAYQRCDDCEDERDVPAPRALRPGVLVLPAADRIADARRSGPAATTSSNGFVPRLRRRGRIIFYNHDRTLA